MRRRSWLGITLMTAKGVFALTLGTVATICLLYIMQALIESGEPVITKVEIVKMVDMLRIKEERHVEVKQRKAERPPPPDELPPAPQPEILMASAERVNYQMEPLSLDRSLDIGRVQYGAVDSEYLPIVKVAPAYPVEAAMKDLVGWVIVEFTVTSHGTVEDPVVIANCAVASPQAPDAPCDGHPNRVFDEAAKRAALKFKYAPKMIDGVPIDTVGVRNYFSFRFDD